MSSQPSVTLISIVGDQVNAQGASWAIWRSYGALKEKISQLRCVLVSPEKPTFCPPEILHLPCKPMNETELHVFTLYNLDQLIETDFCLTLRHDAWVLNGEHWRDDFFQYDYLGAATPWFFEYRGNELHLHPSSHWQMLAQQNNPALYPLLDGHFSLRSKKLLGMPRALKLPVTIFPPFLMQALPLSLEWGGINLFCNDVFLCAQHRPQLEDNGIRFAPFNESLHFAVAFVGINEAQGVGLESILGAYWQDSSIALVDANRVLCQFDPSTLENVAMQGSLEHKTVGLLMDYGYEITLPA